MDRLWSSVLSFVLWLAALAPAGAVTGATPEFKKIADDVYAFIGKTNDANALVIITTQGVVVVDTGHDTPQSRLLLKHIQAVTSQPVRTVIITQNHADHSGGTPLFSPPATVIVHDRVAKDWADLKPYQIKSWRRRFPERGAMTATMHPLDAAVSFAERMTLRLGGKTIELIYIDDPYNPGDVAVWLPAERVLHAAFVGYLERHPDIRPDYSHGTTMGMLKQLDAFAALQPKVMLPAHGPLGSAKDLAVLSDYLLAARQKVRRMMDQGLALADIEKQFNMNEYPSWDRGLHLEAMAAAIHRELEGKGPEIIAMSERVADVTLSKVTESGLFLWAVTADGRELRLRASVWCNVEGVDDRSFLQPGMKANVRYLEPQGGKAPQGFEITDLIVQR